MSTNTRTLIIDKNDIEQQLIDGNLGVAIKMMLAILKAHDSSDYNDMILQSSAYSALQRQKMNNLISNNNASMTTNRITHTVRHYWSKLKPDWTVEFEGLPAADNPAPRNVSEGASPSVPAAEEDNESSKKKTILFLSSNPMNTRRLAIDQEIREVKESIKIARGRDNFIIEQAEALGLKEFRRAVLEYRPHIIHFSGHGSPDGQIMLHGPNEGSREISEEALGKFFEVLIKFGSPLECVVLNACYSEPQAKEIARSVDYVVGMRSKVEDKTAIAFATSFYEVLANGKGYEAAFEIAQVNIMMEGYDGNDLPVIMKEEDN